MVAVSHAVLISAGGTCMKECIGWKVPRVYRSLQLMTTLFWAIVIVSALKRTVSEDKLLQRTFDKEWLLWAEQTRYRLMPGVY